MGRDPFGIMFQFLKFLGFLLVLGWATSTAADSEKTILCISSSDNGTAVCGPVTRLPGNLVCNVEPADVNQLSQGEALTLAQMISENCLISHRGCLKTSEKRTLPFQVAALLVSKFEEFTPEILSSLGQVAVGLSVAQIELGIHKENTLASLPTLSKVQGWNVQQAAAILRKLFNSGYQIQDGNSLAALGSLVVGLNHVHLQGLSPETVLDALEVPGFATQLENLSPTWKIVFGKKIVILPRLKCFRHTSHLIKRELASLVRTLQSARHKRSPESECPPGKNVTNEIAQDDLMPLDYSEEELHACLGIPVLIKNLALLSTYAFTEEQLHVIKAKLNETGYPDEVLHNLGSFKDLLTPEDIKNLRDNSTETFALRLNKSLSPEQATTIIRQYTDSGGPLNAEALNVIGTKYICLLDSNQLKRIDENAINKADPLNISNCNQITKDILYPKAKRAFSDRHNPPKYYGLIKPYLGGAPADDLRALSKDNVNMDIDTFMELKPDSLLPLKPSDVKDLLGRNLKDLKGQEKIPPVKEWIARQKQSDLDQLGIGLKGGTPDGYINITPRHNGPPEASGATRGHPLHLLSSFLMTLLLTSFLS